MAQFSQDAPIFLVGFMAVGKTTWGARLARARNVPFVDLDDRVAALAGLSIPDIFRLRGEHAFRALEREALQAICGQPSPMVVATGGGTPCHFDSMQRMLDTGPTIYLALPEPLLAARLASETKRRPLLQGRRPTELQNYVTETLQARSPIYERAHLTMDARFCSEELLDMALRHLLHTP